MNTYPIKPLFLVLSLIYWINSFNIFSVSIMFFWIFSWLAAQSCSKHRVSFDSFEADKILINVIVKACIHLDDMLLYKGAPYTKWHQEISGLKALALNVLFDKASISFYRTLITFYLHCNVSPAYTCTRYVCVSKQKPYLSSESIVTRQSKRCSLFAYY